MATTEAETIHLWDARHPYYAQEGNYYRTGCHNQVRSWAAFMDEMGDSDPDLNLVYRWDWKIPDPDVYREGDELPGESLCIYFMGQRKAFASSWEVTPISRDDEAGVRAWLTERAKTITAIWAPIGLAE